MLNVRPFAAGLTVLDIKALSSDGAFYLYEIRTTSDEIRGCRPLSGIFAVYPERSRRAGLTVLDIKALSSDRAFIIEPLEQFTFSCSLYACYGFGYNWVSNQSSYGGAESLAESFISDEAVNVLV